jgi:ATP-dependent Zn protease
LPDVKGRERILNVHMSKVPAADDVEVKYIVVAAITITPSVPSKPSISTNN